MFSSLTCVEQSRSRGLPLARRCNFHIIYHLDSLILFSRHVATVFVFNSFFFFFSQQQWWRRSNIIWGLRWVLCFLVLRVGREMSDWCSSRIPSQRLKSESRERPGWVKADGPAGLLWIQSLVFRRSWAVAVFFFFNILINVSTSTSGHINQSQTSAADTMKTILEYKGLMDVPPKH